jgi:hypothetical protein
VDGRRRAGSGEDSGGRRRAGSGPGEDSGGRRAAANGALDDEVDKDQGDFISPWPRRLHQTSAAGKLQNSQVHHRRENKRQQGRRNPENLIPRRRSRLPLPSAAVTATTPPGETTPSNLTFGNPPVTWRKEERRAPWW